MNEEEHLLRLTDAAKRLSISERHLRELIKQGEIVFVNVGRAGGRASLRFRATDIQSFVEKRLTIRSRTNPNAKPRNNTSRLRRDDAFGMIDFAARRAARMRKTK